MDYILLSAMILGIVQGIKMLVGPTSKWIPTIAILVGLGLIAMFSVLNHVPVTWEAVVNGLIASLTAVGLWSGTKSTLK